MSKMLSSRNPLIDEDEEELLEQVKRVPEDEAARLARLNRKKLTKAELDEVFLDE